MGCLRSCLDYLDLDISDGWLYGGTGHAFIINLTPDQCPSGPTAWKSEKLFKLGRNLGYSIDGVFGFKSQPDFHEVQSKAFEHVKKSIDAGLPCYGWELIIPEFYMVNGYDETGYYYLDMDGPQRGPKPWKRLGDKGIGIVEMYSVQAGEQADDRVTVKGALEFALKHANTREYLMGDYQSGLEGYETWIKGLDTKEGTVGGAAYNAAVWAECRGYAVEFLEEAAERLDRQSLFEEAVESYRKSSGELNIIKGLYPFKVPPDYETRIQDTEKAKTAVAHLTRAMEAERVGLKSLGKIVDGL